MANQPPPPPPPPPPQSSGANLSTIRTYILIALIFSIIFTIVWLLAAISEFVSFATLSALAFEFTGYFAGVFIVYGVVLLIWAVLSLLIFLRIWKMWKAVNANDIATLKATSNILWAVLAIIFGGVIPGIMLLIADGPIKQL